MVERAVSTVRTASSPSGLGPSLTTREKSPGQVPLEAPWPRLNCLESLAFSPFVSSSTGTPGRATTAAMSGHDTLLCDISLRVLRSPAVSGWGCFPPSRIQPPKPPPSRGAGIDPGQGGGIGQHGWGGVHLLLQGLPEGAPQQLTVHHLEEAGHRIDGSAWVEMLHLPSVIARLRDRSPEVELDWPVWRLPKLRRTGLPPSPVPVSPALLGSLAWALRDLRAFHGLSRPTREAERRLDLLLAGEKPEWFPVGTDPDAPTTLWNFEEGLLAMARELAPPDASVARDTNRLKAQLREALAPVLASLLPGVPASMSDAEVRALRPRILKIVLRHPDMDGIPQDNRLLLAGEILCLAGVDVPPSGEREERDLRLADRMRKAWKKATAA